MGESNKCDVCDGKVSHILDVSSLFKIVNWVSLPMALIVQVVLPIKG